MNEQMGLFDPVAGEAAKEEAITRVEDHAETSWLAAAWQAVLHVHDSRPDYYRLTSDDVWRALEYDGMPEPHEPRAMGAVMRRAVAEGLLVATPDFRPSDLARNHRRPVRVYTVAR